MLKTSRMEMAKENLVWGKDFLEIFKDFQKLKLVRMIIAASMKKTALSQKYCQMKNFYTNIGN